MNKFDTGAGNAISPVLRCTNWARTRGLDLLVNEIDDVVIDLDAAPDEGLQMMSVGNEKGKS